MSEHLFEERLVAEGRHWHRGGFYDPWQEGSWRVTSTRGGIFGLETKSDKDAAKRFGVMFEGSTFLQAEDEAEAMIEVQKYLGPENEAHDQYVADLKDENVDWRELALDTWRRSCLISRRPRRSARGTANCVALILWSGRPVTSLI